MVADYLAIKVGSTWQVTCFADNGNLLPQFGARFTSESAARNYGSELVRRYVAAKNSAV